MNTKKSPSAADSWADSIEEIDRLKLIYATLPTGAKMVLRTLTLDELAAVDGLPEDLVRVAILEMSPGGITGEIARILESDDEDALGASQKLSEANLQLTNRLVQAAVVQPVLTAKHVETLDGYDKAMIAGIASRRIAFDAAGRRVGVEPLDTFATFREFHGCDDTRCEACEAARLALSTVQPG